MFKIKENTVKKVIVAIEVIIPVEKKSLYKNTARRNSK